MSLEEKSPKRNPARDYREERTVRFLRSHLTEGSKVLDLGNLNPLSRAMSKAGYQVSNCISSDLDFDVSCVEQDGFDAFTSFEVFEHMVNPLSLLSAIKTPVLYASVPLSLWFAKAYRGNTDEDAFDEHYHEFEPWQFELLLKKSGWQITHREQWASYDRFPKGIRPVLRRFFPRYYLVRAVRKP